MQALDRTAPLLPLRRARSSAARTTTNAIARPSLFAALHVATGEVLGDTYTRQRSREFRTVHNETGKPYVWTKTADEVLASIARFAQRTLQAHPA